MERVSASQTQDGSTGEELKDLPLILFVNECLKANGCHWKGAPGWFLLSVSMRESG